MQKSITLHKKPIYRTDGFWGMLFLFPTIIGFVVFTIVPVFMSLLYSFTNYDGVTPYSFIGMKNYIKLFGNKEFLNSLWNTCYFAIGTVPIGCLVALMISVVLNQNMKLKSFYRACYFMPTIVSMVAISVVFQQIFNKDYGLANALLAQLGLPAQDWLASTTQAMPCVIFVSIWKGLGFNVVIFLAGLTGVDPQLYEAASIDGANVWTKLWKITMPSLRPTIAFVLINNTISSFQAFDQIYMLTSGGPAKATQTISYLIYNNAFSYFKQGYASAMAYILFIVILIVSILQLRVSADSNPAGAKGGHGYLAQLNQTMAGNTSSRGKRVFFRTLTHAFLLITSLTMMVPFIWMILSSFKADGEILSIPITWLPKVWHPENYVITFQTAPWGLYFRNTTVITLAAVAGQIIVASMAAYAFARLEFKGKNVLFIIYLSTMMLPYQVTMIPTFKIIRTLGWIDNLLSLIIPSVFSAFGVFMLRQFFLSIPSELEDAAKIDGCGHVRIYYEIILKNSTPALVTLTLFIFMGTWNDFLRPMLYLNKQELWTLSLGLSKFKGVYTSLWSNMMCGAVVCIMPILLVFLFAQNYFIEGIVTSGLKG